ncbi:hypothetical protein GXP67_27260 [Rhodocytophaga rosea]|uniref:Uncharacterized protein n=1 Tax=Rhodocytophaga rosea TaxID=2704465 RepID=A0A6C0GPW1_9BACT|nr:hypothetical protein [Rhodocytophaga rosea]QHT70081.1 hypothetical protein GXP67_27260 [Rhodocytophaga rosea]
MIVRLALVFFCCSICLKGVSQDQRFLILDKPGHVKRLRYYAGDELIFKLKGDRMKYKDVIEAVGDSTIKVRGADIPLRDIKSVIRYKQGGMLDQAIYILPRAGLLYFLADTFNPVFRGNDPDISRSGIVVGSSFIAGGLLLKLAKKRNYRINNFRRLRTLETF